MIVALLILIAFLLAMRFKFIRDAVMIIIVVFAFTALYQINGWHFLDNIYGAR